MKRIGFAALLLLLSSTAVWAQFTPSNENLHGLTGVRLIVMYQRAEGLEASQRPAVLKILEEDATAKLQMAGLQLFHYEGEMQKAGYPRLVVLVTLDKVNGFVHPIVTEVKLLQKVQLVRDPSVAFDAVSWARYGVGGPTLDLTMLRNQTNRLVEEFIKDYQSANQDGLALGSKTAPKN